MFKKSKLKKIKVLVVRQLLISEKLVFKKKVKLIRQFYSFSEIYQLQINSSVDDDNVDIFLFSNSRFILFLNFFFSILEYGFSWFRRKSSLKLVTDQKRVRSFLLFFFLDSGLFNFLVFVYDDLFFLFNEIKKNKEVLFFLEFDRNFFLLLMVLEYNFLFFCSDGEIEN